MSLEKRVKRRVTAREHSFFAVTLPGFEGAAVKELEGLGINNIISVERGGVLFSGRISDCWRVNLMARVITRVLMRLFEFRAKDFFTVYEKTGKFEWELFVKEGSELEVRVSSSSSKLYHTGRIKIEAEKGIARAFNGTVSFDSGSGAGQIVHLRVHEDICTVSLDSSGDHLYQRGYKRGPVAASLRESTAAAVLIEADFEKYDYIVDPMCGSGTFSVEAASMICGKPAAYDRGFPFEAWPSFSRAGYGHLKKGFHEKIMDSLPAGKRIIAFDSDESAVDAARINADAAGFADIIQVFRGDFFSESIDIPPEKKGLVVLNPPYGERLSLSDSTGFYRRIKDTLEKKYKGCASAVIIPGEEIERAAGFRCSRKIGFSNGGIPVALLLSG